MVWALRYGIGLSLLIHLMELAGAAAPLTQVVRAAWFLGLLTLLLGFLVASKRSIVSRLRVDDSGHSGWLWSAYNTGLDRVYLLIVVANAVVVVLLTAGYSELANHLLRCSAWCVAVLVLALYTFHRGRGPVGRLARRCGAPELGDNLSVWGEAAPGILLGAATALVWADIYSPAVSVIDIVTSPTFLSLTGSAGGAALIVLMAYWLAAGATGAIERFFAAMFRNDPGGTAFRRSRTLQPLLISICRYSIYFVASILALRQVGFDPTPLLAGAGVIGVAVGFGAQSLVKDVITGFFIIAEDLVAVGDAVEINGKTGQVETITVRTTQIRLSTGELRTIPNGDIRQLGNFSRGFLRATVTVSLAYDSDVEQAMELLGRLATEFHEANRAVMQAPPDILGVTEWTATDVQMRVVFTCKPSEQGRLEREFRRIVKRAFDAAGLEFPYVRQRVYRVTGRSIGPEK
ncbi:MAG: mechanosensitive ion channel family protein [Candidatus Riflebacteria bacterium]|nr:mechanosensitive ion channel family protein [Candidatus Riflebacteria bacterium]